MTAPATRHDRAELDRLLEAVSRGIGRAMPQIKRVAPLATVLGTMSTDALQSEDQTPAVYVNLAGTGEMSFVETGETELVGQLVAYILIVDADVLEKQRLNLDIVEGLLRLIPSNRWGLAFALPALAAESADLHGLTSGFKPDVSSWRVGVSVLARAADLYGGEDPPHELSIWAVTWEQSLRIGPIPDEWVGSRPTEVFARERGDAPDRVFPTDVGTPEPRRDEWA